jgi:hypothetical protein
MATIKERLFKEYVIAQNKLDKLNGVTPIFEASEEFFTRHNFRYLATTYTKEELRRNIEYAKLGYDVQVEKLRIENYYNTEEGKERKATLEKKMKDLEDAIDKYVVDEHKRLNAFIKEWLGEDWGCNFYGGTMMDIGIVEKVTDNNYNSFLFGHSFSLYFGNRFEMNYGTMGSFDVFKSEKRVQFLVGMAKFAENKDKLEYLKSRLSDAANFISLMNCEYNDLNDELKHPFGKKNNVF